MSDSTALLGYVTSTAALLGLPLDDAQAARVTTQLARTAAMAALLDDVPLGVHDEPADLYCPAPWVEFDPVTDVRGPAR
jgi:hypothetical protein